MPSSSRPITRLRKLSLALPDAHEVEAWGSPTFRVRNKIFAMYADANDHHGAGRPAVWLKAAPGDQEAMVGPRRVLLRAAVRRDRRAGSGSGSMASSSGTTSTNSSATPIASSRPNGCVPCWMTEEAPRVESVSGTVVIGKWRSGRMRYHRYEAAILGVPLCLVLSGCFGPRPETMTLKQSARLVLYEGLPHQMYEHQALEAEKKTKPTVTLHEFPFYRETLESEARRRRSPQGPPGRPGLLRSPTPAGKRCGGFHPDYAVEWSAVGQTYQALICFGCWEIKIYGPKGETIYDIRNAARDRLKPLLEPYRKNRPPFKET